MPKAIRNPSELRSRIIQLRSPPESLSVHDLPESSGFVFDEPRLATDIERPAVTDSLSARPPRIAHLNGPSKVSAVSHNPSNFVPSVIKSPVMIPLLGGCETLHIVSLGSRVRNPMKRSISNALDFSARHRRDRSPG